VRCRLAILGLTGPAYLWLLVAVFLPLTAMLYFSVLSETPLGNREPVLTGEHYRAFLEKSVYRDLLWRSLGIGLEVTAFCALIGFPAALALSRAVPGRWREVVFLLVVLPFWSNGLVRTFSWTMVLGAGGVLDRGLQALWPDAPEVDLLFTRQAVVIGLVHAYLPYMILSCYLALQAVDDSLILAARGLGASHWTVFRRLWLPLGLPGLVAGSVLIFVPVIGAFMEPRILGGPAGTVIGTVIEDQFTQTFNWPLGAALSFILLAVVLLILLLAYPLRQRLERVT